MLMQHWSRMPTVRDMVAGYLGVEPRTESTRRPQTEAEFLAAFLRHGTLVGRA
jgi:hypothetical protein